MTDQQLSAIAGLTQAVEKHTDKTIQAVQLIHQAREELETAQGSFLQRDEQAADSRKLAGLTVNQLQAETVKQVRAEHGNVISPPTVSGTSSVIINQQATLTVTADSLLSQVVIADFTLTRPDGSTDTVMAVNGQATFTTPVTGAVGSDQTFKVTSTDSLGNISNPAQYVISIIDNQAPVMDGFSYSVPSVAIRGEAITARFLGATDPDGDNSQVTYRIVDTLGVTAGKTSGIGHNEAVTLTVDQISADMAGRITVKAVDQAGVQSAGVVIPLDLRARAVVVKPVGLAPINGATDIAQQPQITGSAFATNPEGFGAHSVTNIRVATDADMKNIVSTMALGAVTSAQIGRSLALNTKHWYQIQHGSAELGLSEWSDPVSFTTVAAELPQNVFSTALYTGNGSSQTINTGIDLANDGGLVWLKDRSAVDSHALVDTVNGPTKRLTSNSSDAAQNFSTHFDLRSQGFDLLSPGINVSGRSYVSWSFRKAPKFFDVVTWTGDGVSGRAVGHDLGVVPGMIIVKRLDSAGSWVVLHRGLGGSGNELYLHHTGVKVASLSFTSTEPTASSFYVNNYGRVNALGGSYVAYIFAHDPSDSGIIQCGSWQSASSHLDVNVELGWEPQYLLYKSAGSSGGGWYISDNMRGTGADKSTDMALTANDNSAEFLMSRVGFHSTGFKCMAGLLSNTYIYMAIRAPIPV